MRRVYNECAKDVGGEDEHEMDEKDMQKGGSECVRSGG